MPSAEPNAPPAAHAPARSHWAFVRGVLGVSRVVDSPSRARRAPQAPHAERTVAWKGSSRAARVLAAFTPGARTRSLALAAIISLPAGCVPAVLAVAETGTPASRTGGESADRLAAAALNHRDVPPDAHRRAKPEHSAALSAATSCLSPSFTPLMTDRFVIVSDASPDRLMPLASWVERTAEEFHRFTKHMHLAPSPLRHRLVCVVFADHRDYVDFAREHDNMTHPAFTGYYSPRHDRMVFPLSASRARHDDDAVEPATTRDAARPQAGVVGFEPSEPAAPAPAASTNATFSRRTGEPPPRANGVNMPAAHDACDAAAKCTHETIHQLMFHTGVMSRDVQYPLWICEGLSTAFETLTPHAPFGPDHEYAPRREAFDRLLARDALLPLRELITMTTLHHGSERHARALYQQSYALVTWMCRHRAAALRDYLAAMRDEPPGRLTRDRHVTLFEASFGDVDDVAAQWLMHERNAAGH